MAAVDAVLVEAVDSPDAAWFEGVDSVAERLDLVRVFYAGLHGRILSELAGMPVEIERLTALGMWAIRGAPEDIARLRDPEGPLKGLPVRILEDATSHTMGGGPDDSA